ITHLHKAVFALALGVGLGTVGVLWTPAPVDAAGVCAFSRDLWIGSAGEDVRCLQRFLNSNGYHVSTWGAGAPGYETTVFGPRTASAVALWQRANGYTPTGIFSVSMVSGYGYGQNYASSYFGSNNQYYTNSSNYSTSNREDARDAINNAEDDYDDAVNEYDDARSAGRSVGDAKDFLDDARRDIRDARNSYNDGEYQDASDSADDAQNEIDDALDEID
ncbi:MAG: peptidoglycan-binding protein, partial [Patescibacteria group bacterium]